MAKCKRDALIEELHKEFGNFGSGYPSDVRTTQFLRDYVKKHKKAPVIARKSWDTTKRIINEEISSKKITDFLS